MGPCVRRDDRECYARSFQISNSNKHPAAQQTRLSVPNGLPHSRAGLRQLFEAAVDLRAVHADILQMAIVELAQGLDARRAVRGARSPPRKKRLTETAQARQPNRSSQSKNGLGAEVGTLVSIVMAMFFKERPESGELA